MCPTLCDPMDCSPPGSPIHGIFQARVLEWVAIFFSRGSSWPRDRTWVSHTAGWRFYHLSPQGSPHNKSLAEKHEVTDFPGGPVVKTPCFWCRGRKFDPWSGRRFNPWSDPTCHGATKRVPWATIFVSYKYLYSFFSLIPWSFCFGGVFFCFLMTALHMY